jgi:internalin A
VAAAVEAMWVEDGPAADLLFDLPFLHPAVMRGIISQIGRMAGISAVYWKYGACLYEKTTRSRALIEERRIESPTAWSGQIAVSIRGGQATELLRQLRKWIEDELDRSGCRDWRLKETSFSIQPDPEPKDGRDRSGKAGREDLVPERKLEFTPPPSDKLTYCVSYAWNDESKAIVDRLCAEAEQHGIKILRDISGMGLGESITRFMRQLGAGDRVFVILSEKYLKSEFCMFELLEVWRNCKMDVEAFRGRIRVYRLPDAQMVTVDQRLRCASHWDKQFTELDKTVRKERAYLLGESDFKRYKLMRDFAHHVGEMLALIADTLLPADFEELKTHGFGDTMRMAAS